MFTRSQLAKKYLQYYLKASNGTGHGIHSPFVFDFIDHVLNDKTNYPCFAAIEAIRKKLLSDETVIEVEDMGAGSSLIKTNRRMVKHIARSSLKPKKYAQLLFRVAQYYKCRTVIELGTSLGITSAYLASADPASKLLTCEGAKSIAAIARRNFEELKLKNIHLAEGDFDHTLPSLLNSMWQVDLAFVDGNHRTQPTLNYFQQLLDHSTSSTILIFDDIHWSEGMEQAWEKIKQHPSVTLTIDLFFIGLVFMNPDFKVPQHFSIRY